MNVNRVVGMPFPCLLICGNEVECPSHRKDDSGHFFQSHQTKKMEWWSRWRFQFHFIPTYQNVISETY